MTQWQITNGWALCDGPILRRAICGKPPPVAPRDGAPKNQNFSLNLLTTGEA